MWFSPLKYPRERHPETMILLNNFAVLVENVKQHLKLNQVHVLCHLVECLITGIVLQKKGIDLQDESETESKSHDGIYTPFESTNDIPKEMLALLKKQSGLVDNFITRKLNNLEYSAVAEWHKELQVGNC